MANENSKPSIKMAIKPAGGDKSERIYIAAAWRDENGKMGGLRLDREVEQLAIKMRDGRVIRMTQAPGDNGRPRWSHFLDLFINDEAPRSESRGGGYGGERSNSHASKPAASGDEFGTDDFGGDDIPFDAAPSAVGPTEGAIRRFWSHVEKTESCWLWTASVGSHGYGNTHDGTKVCTAHRLSYRIHFGEVPAGKFVLHECDNKRCVRPDHLRAGTHVENMDDAAKRTRMPRKLSASQARWIKTAGLPTRRMAIETGVSQATVLLVLHGKTHRYA